MNRYEFALNDAKPEYPDEDEYITYTELPDYIGSWEDVLGPEPSQVGRW